MTFKKILTLALFMAALPAAVAQNEPVLLLSKQEATEIKAHLQDYKVLGHSYEKVLKTAEKALKHSMEVPAPKDNGGGYTHEKHKQNYREMLAAATVYRVGGDKSYAEFVEKMLLQYATMYPGLPLHPMKKDDNGAGKLFWQSLNDYVWLVNGIQAYDLVRDNISPANREVIERDVFRSMANFISESPGKKEIFNYIHNHGTWATAAVGMTGFVLKDKDMVDKALYGSDKDGKTGFLKQVQDLFSPDGYYSEGPYYQRYAFQPFMVFAEAIERNRPDVKIFEYKNGVLGKAAKTIFQLTDSNGKLLPFNDAIKGKSFMTEELVIAADVAYTNYNDASLLPVILAQKEVIVNGVGLKAAQGLQTLTGKEKYKRESVIIADGADGKSGGVSVLRTQARKGDGLTLVFKYASQGMGHGHYDRLGLMLYDGDKEVLQDYGAARFVNVESKSGGRYLKENRSYAQQSIAHNTVITDETSHYDAEWKKGEEHSPELVFSDIANPQEVQIVSARENNAYTGIAMQRTVALIGGNNSFVIDVFSLESKENHQYDLNYMYNGHIMETDYKYEPAVTALTTLGSKNGYQHVWQLAEATGNNGVSKFTFLTEDTFYTIASITNAGSKLFFTKSGANDPEFNLRNESGYLIRETGKANQTFVSVIEPHGHFEHKMELSKDPHSGVKDLVLLTKDNDYTAVKVTFITGEEYTLLFANNSMDAKKSHKLSVNGQEYKWKGNFLLIKK